MSGILVTDKGKKHDGNKVGFSASLMFENFE